jgi:hypothetical protein
MLDTLLHNLSQTDKPYHIIYGKTMSGKTTLIKELINTNQYDYILLDCFTIHTFNIQSIKQHNVLLLLESNIKEKCFIFDDFDKLYSQNNIIISTILNELYKLKYKCIFTISNKNFKGSGLINKKKHYYYTLQQNTNIYTSKIKNFNVEEKLKIKHTSIQDFIFTFENDTNIELFIHENTNPTFSHQISNYDITQNSIYLYHYKLNSNTIKFPKLISINKKLKFYNDTDFYTQYIHGHTKPNKRNHT